MTFYLNSRVQRIFTPTSYRDIKIHEMTESEIDALKAQRVMLPVLGLIAGFIAGAVFMAAALSHF